MATKKTSSLTNDLIAVKGQAIKPIAVVTKKPTPEAAEAAQPLNFKVPAQFRKEFKTIALEDDLKLNELLYRCFEAYKKSR